MVWVMGGECSGLRRSVKKEIVIRILREMIRGEKRTSLSVSLLKTRLRLRRILLETIKCKKRSSQSLSLPKARFRLISILLEMIG